MIAKDADILNNDNDEKFGDKRQLNLPKRLENKITVKEWKMKKSNEDMAGKNEKINKMEDSCEQTDDQPGDGYEDSPSRAQIFFEKVCSKIGVNPNLFFLKVTLFCMYGATACLIPYLTVHMQSIGLTVEDIGTIYLLLPLTTFLAPPVTGYLVDKMGNYKPVVIISMILNLIFHHSLLFIPHQELPGVMPHGYIVRHPSTGIVEVWWSPCPSRECPDEDDLHMVLDDCVDYCLLQTDDPNQPKRRKIPVLPVSIAVMPPDIPKNPGSFSGVSFGTETTRKPPSNKVVVKKGSMDGKKHNETAKFEFVFEKNKTTQHPKRKGKKANRHKTDEDSEEAALFYIEMHDNLGDPIEQLGLEVEQDDNDTVTDFRTRFEAELLIKAGVNVTALDEFDLRCGGIVMATNLTYMKLKELADDCMLQKCNFSDGGPEICPPDYKESDDNIFWIYFVLRLIGTTMLSGCVTILDPVALMLIQRFGGEFGRERLFSCIGMAIFSPLTGVLIDSFSSKLGYTDYSAAFYAYDILLAISVVSVILMPLSPTAPADNIIQDTVAIVKMPHVVLFIFFLLLLGSFWGFIESYVFLYLKELGASNYLLGITVTVGTISSMPFLHGADKILKKFGHINIIVCAFFTHAIRLMGYSFIEEAWWCYPFEAMEALSVHLLWIAAATYCALLAPKNLLATLIGILGMAHFSLGRGAGSFVGGVLIGTVGTRKSFRIMGIVAIVGGIVYYLLHFFWLKNLKVVKELQAQAEAEESARLNEEELPQKPATRDVGISAERLSLMVEFHHRGSLTSLDRSIASFQRSSNLIKSNLEVYNRRRSTSSLFHKHSTPNLPRHDSLNKDKIFKDSSTSFTPLPLKKSIETMLRLEELPTPCSDSSLILEEEEITPIGKNEKTSVGVP